MDYDYSNNLRWSGLLLIEDVNKELEEMGYDSVWLVLNEDERGWTIVPELDDELEGLGWAVETALMAPGLLKSDGFLNRYDRKDEWTKEYRAVVEEYVGTLIHLHDHGELPEDD